RTTNIFSDFASNMTSITHALLLSCLYPISRPICKSIRSLGVRSWERAPVFSSFHSLKVHASPGINVDLSLIGPKSSLSNISVVSDESVKVEHLPIVVARFYLFFLIIVIIAAEWFDVVLEIKRVCLQ